MDWLTKVATIVALTDTQSMSYVVEALYADMWRSNNPDPYGVVELKRVISEILLMRSYVKHAKFRYSEAFKPAGDRGPEDVCLAHVRNVLDKPLAFFEKTEGPERDATWL